MLSPVPCLPACLPACSAKPCTLPACLPACSAGNKSRSDVNRLGVHLIQATGISRTKETKTVDPFTIVKCEKVMHTTKTVVRVSGSMPARPPARPPARLPACLVQPWGPTCCTPGCTLPWGPTCCTLPSRP